MQQLARSSIACLASLLVTVVIARAEPDPVSPAVVSAQASVDSLKQAAVAAARNGEHAEALKNLNDLAAAHPDRTDILHDKIVVLIWAGQAQAGVDLYEMLAATAPLPAYVSRAVAPAYRNLKAFPQAEAIYRQLLTANPDDADAHLGLVLVLRDRQQLPEAIAAVDAALQKHPAHVELLLARVNIRNEMEDPIATLKALNSLLALEPLHIRAMNLKALVISDMGAVDAALRYSESCKPIMHAATLYRLESNMAAHRIAWREPELAVAILDKLIAEEPEPMSRVRARCDRILALFPLHRMPEVIDAYEELLENEIEPPFWIIDAAAAANLNLMQPHRAEELYRQVLEIAPNRFDTRFGLYSALVDLGRFREASKVREKLMSETPEWLMDRGVLRYNWRKQSVMLAEGWLEAYQDRQSQAEAFFKEAREIAPASKGVRTGLGQVEAWRGRPRAAVEELNIVITRGGYTDPTLPAHVSEHELAAKNGVTAALNSANYQTEARKYSERIVARNDYNLHSRKINRALESEDRFSIFFDAVFLHEMPGIDEYYYLLELTQPITHWLSAYYSYFNRETQSDQTIVQRRHAVGVDIDLRPSLTLRQEVSTDQHNPEEDGYLSRLTWSLGDKWQFSGSHNTFSLDVPFRARADGQEGESSSLSARFRQSERLSMRAAALLNELDDGNDNTTYLLSAEQRLLSRGYWQSKLILEYAESENSRSDVDYFSPPHASSAYLSHVLQHTVFRRYDDAFVHRLHVGLGYYDQAFYDPEPIWHVRYEHDYLINDRFSLLWGLNFKTRSYDSDKTDVISWYLTARKTF